MKILHRLPRIRSRNYKTAQTIEEKIEEIYIEYCSENSLNIDCESLQQLAKIHSLLRSSSVFNWKESHA